MYPLGSKRKSTQALLKGCLGFALIGILTLGLEWARGKEVSEVSANDSGSDATLLEGCRSSIQRFRKTYSWYEGQNRILVEARSACGSKYGNLMDLSDVRVTIESGGRKYAVLHTDSATYSSSENRLQLYRSQGNRQEGCLGDLDSLSINFGTGELLAPGYRETLGQKGQLLCG